MTGALTVELHLARPNPVWRALAERPRALPAVVADCARLGTHDAAAMSRQRRVRW